jgi:predicted permease
MLARLRSLWRLLRHRSAFERNMDDELAFHLSSRIDALVHAGFTREQAVRRARLEFGNPEAWQDSCRDARRLHLIDDAGVDLRFAWRTLRRNRALSAAVIVTLALAVGATTAIFSVVNGVLLRPLPYPEPDRLFIVGALNNDGRISTVVGPDFTEWRAQCPSCGQLAAYSGTWPSNVSGGTEPVRVRVSRVTDNLFSTVGVQPVLGRTFLPEETGRPLFGGGQTPITAVILSYGLWQRLGEDRSIVGRTVTVEGDVCTVVGVMPRGFAFPDDADAWVPVEISETRNNAYLRVIARLGSGVTSDSARAQLEVVANRLNEQRYEERRLTGITLMPLHEYVVGRIRSSLLVFMGAVGLVLLIACANVANLLLAQAAARPRELAVRSALGAGRSRIVRQLLTESLLLSVLGGIAGWILAVGLVRAFSTLAPSDIPRVDAVSVDGWMLAFTLGLSVVTGLLFGLAPVVRAASPDLNASLQEGTARAAGGAERNGIRKLLVVAEVAIASVLLIGAGLLIKSFVELHRAPIGFDPTGSLSASITLPESTYPTTARARAFLQTALERISALPDVRAAAIVNALPLSREGARINGDFAIDGESRGRRGAWGRKLAVGGEYFRAVGIPLVKGRLFTERDAEDAPAVVVISESLARRFWPNQDPLGHRVNTGFSARTWSEIVGVVGDVKHDEVGEPLMGAVYHPYRQIADSRRWFLGDMSFVVRTSGPPERAAGALRDAVAHIDKDLPLYAVMSMTDVVADRITDPRFYTLLLASFSLLALVLATAGIYGLVSYSVTQRTHEIGIRVALGAHAGSVLRLIVADGMLLVTIGSAIGIAGALASTRVLSRFLYGVTPTDRGTFVAISLVLAAVAMLACYLPARRALKVDPILALRRE